MVNFEIRGACDWVLCIWDAWDEWSVLISLFLSLVEDWKSFGKGWLGEIAGRKNAGILGLQLALQR